MAEYIERSEALIAINEFYHDPKVDIAIRSIPSADVVEVVRCSECSIGAVLHLGLSAESSAEKAPKYVCTQTIFAVTEKGGQNDERGSWKSLC